MAIDAIFRAFGLALGQIGDRRFRRVLVLGLGLTLALLVGSAAGLVWLVDWLIGDSIRLPLLGEVNWIDDFFSWGAALLLMVLSVFLMVPVAAAITSFFLDDVADAVEAVHYPHLPQKPRAPLWEALRDMVSYLGVMIVVNLAALVLYLIFNVAGIVIFWAVNGLLLGREYYTLAALRRVGHMRARGLRRQHFLTIWAAGTLMAIPLTVPVLNLLIPILGAATFTHLFQMLPQGRPGPSSSPDRPR